MKPLFSSINAPFISLELSSVFLRYTSTKVTLLIRRKTEKTFTSVLSLPWQEGCVGEDTVSSDLGQPGYFGLEDLFTTGEEGLDTFDGLLSIDRVCLSKGSRGMFVMGDVS